MADKSIDTENGYEILKDGYYVYFEKTIGKFHKWIFCDNVKPITDTIDFYPCTDSKIQAVHVFKTEKSAQKFIDEFCINFEEHDNLKIARIPNTLGEWYESKKSTRKSMKESINGDCYIYYDDDDNKRLVFCDYVKGITDTRNWFYLNEYIIDAIHIFKNEKQAQKFIDEHLKYFADQDKVVIAEYPQTVSGFFESKKSARKSIKESSDVTDKIASEIDKSYWIDKLIDDLDRHYESMEKAWLKNLDKLSDEDILGVIDDCMGKSKTLVGKSEMLKNKMIDDLSKAYDDYIDDIDRQIRIGKSEDEIKEMIKTTLENDIKMYLKLAYNNKASSNYFMVKFAEDNLI